MNAAAFSALELSQKLQKILFSLPWRERVASVASGVG
jgi:hypothetical protein